MISIESVLVEIQAPQLFVWQVLVDFARYPQWNPYTVRVDSRLEIGGPVVLHLPHPHRAGETLITTEVLRVIQEPCHLRYDTGDAMPGLFAVRDQWVGSLAGERSSYRTTDVFSGEYAQVAFERQGAWVKRGFDSVALALKERAELLWERS